MRFLSNGGGVAGTAGKTFRYERNKERSTDELHRHWSWFWAGAIRRGWGVIKGDSAQLKMWGFQEMEDFKKEESCREMETCWAVQTASSAVRIIPSVFLAAGNTLSSY